MTYAALQPGICFLRSMFRGSWTVSSVSPCGPIFGRAPGVAQVEFAPGRMIFQKGSPGNEFYIIKDGFAQV